MTPEDYINIAKDEVAKSGGNQFADWRIVFPPDNSWEQLRDRVTNLALQKQREDIVKKIESEKTFSYTGGFLEAFNGGLEKAIEIINS